MQTTNPHPLWGGTSSEKMKARIPPKFDVDTAMDVANAASWVQKGAEKTDSFNYLSDYGPNEINAARLRQYEISKTNIHKLPGKTPEEKAAAYANLKTALSHHEPSPWYSAQAAKNMTEHNAEEMNQVLDGIEKLEQMPGGNFGGKQISPDGRPISQVLGELSFQQKELLIGLGILREIGFSLKPRKKRRLDPNGNDVTMVPMEEISQLVDLDLLDRLMPDFDLKLISLDFELRKPFSRLEGNKKVYAVAIDRSGSMYQTRKQGIVRAMLATLFEEVRKGEATVYITTFEEQIDGWTKVTNEEEAQQVYTNWKEPRGGNTNIQKVVEEFQAGVKAGKVGEYEVTKENEPELIIVNDGQDYIERTTRTIAPVTALSIQKPNADLQYVCEKSGGKFYLL